MDESQIWALLGFLIGIGMYFEDNLEFHKSISLRNLIIVQGGLKLVSPYCYDSHFLTCFEVYLALIRNL